MSSNSLQLRPYQEGAIDLIRKHKKFALFLFMGAGKTLISLSAVKILLEEGKIKNVLILAPLNVAKTTWPDEIDKWSEFKNISYNVVTGGCGIKDRESKLTNRADITIVNIDMVKWLYDNNHIDWDMVILDESSSVKNSKSKRFNCLKKFKYEYMVALSGTPTPKNYLDLWSQIYLLDNGASLGKTFNNYKLKYFNPVGYKGYNWMPKDENVIFDKVKHIVCTIKPEEYITLPDRIDILTSVPLPDPKEYTQFEKSYILKPKDHEGELEPITIKAVLWNKLAQFCSGSVYMTNEESEIKSIFIHDEKLKALETIIENNPEENILVAYWYKSDLERLKVKFPDALTFTPDTKKMWDLGLVKILLCHPIKDGYGLNLQFGGSTIVWFSMNWDLEKYLQFNARVHRFGQKKPVVINHLIATLPCGKKTLDKIIYEALQIKDICQAKLMEHLLRNFE